MEKYRFIEKLGRGTHGTVYLLETIDDQKYRVVCKSVIEKHLKHARKEVSILSEICHRRIIKLKEYVQIEGTGFIILEYANHGTLDTVVKFFIQKNRKATSYLLWSVISQVSEALEYLHRKKIIHRDIKPSNILINQIPCVNEEILEFKICDFSLAVQTKKEGEYIESAVVGTPFYMAPEVVSRERYNNTVDVWGLGVTLYEMSTFSRPFKGENRGELYNSIKKDSVKKGFVSDKCLEEIVLMCLLKDGRPTSRYLFEMEKVRLHLASLELKIKDNKIDLLEKRIRMLEKKTSWPPTPN